jgi:hypothetical protein
MYDGVCITSRGVILQAGGLCLQYIVLEHTCVVVTARGVTHQVILALAARGSSQDSHTCIERPNDDMLNTLYIRITSRSLAALE